MAATQAVIEVASEANLKNDRANREAARLIERYPIQVKESDPVEFFRNLNADEGWSMNEIGREVGYDGSVVSKVFNANYTGDQEAVTLAFEDARNRLLGSGRGVLIRTQTSEIVEEALLDSIGKEWTTVLYGDSGIGKTETLRRFVARGRGKRNAKKAVMITITMTATVGSMLTRLADALGVDSRGNVERVYDRVVEFLKHNPHLVIIDEMNNLDRMPAKAARIINMLRQINDETKVGLLLSGTWSLHRLIVDPRNREWADMLLSRIRLSAQLPGASLLEARALLMAHFGEWDAKAWNAWVHGYEAIMRASQRHVDLNHGNLRSVGVFVDNARYFAMANKLKEGTRFTPEMIRMIWQRCAWRLKDTPEAQSA